MAGTRQRKRSSNSIGSVAVLFFIGILLAGSSSLNDVRTPSGGGDGGDSGGDGGEMPPDTCSDGIDNDNDGYTDGQDNECAGIGADGNEDGDQPPPPQ